jgi:NAD(P)-dependent dehydrogenase (short-subunit alcohol dehydrogenase family)
MAEDASSSSAAAAAVAPPDPDVARAVSVLEAVARDSALFHSDALAGLRNALAPILEAQRGRMFAGGSREDMSARRAQMRVANREKVRERVHDRRFLENTLARADRVSKLRDLMEGNNAPGVPLLLDASRAKRGHGEGGGDGEDDLEADEEEEEEDEEGEEEEDDEGGRRPKAHRLDAEGLDEAQKSASQPCLTCGKSFRPPAPRTVSSSSSSSSSSWSPPPPCAPCADFHARKRVQAADLTGRTALVTGARTGAGYQCVLKLLRLGASVLALTRFPRDAAVRFAAEADAERWRGRLHVYGLDLRDLVAVEHFCEAVGRDASARLDVLVNNASLGGRGGPVGGVFDPSQPLPSSLPASSSAPADHSEIMRLFQLETGPRGSLPALAVAFLARYEALYSTSPESGPAAAESRTEMDEDVSASAAAADAAARPPPDDAASLSSALVPASALGPSAGPLAWQRLHLDELPTTALLQTLTANAAAPFVLTSRLKHVMLRGQEEDEEAAAPVSAEAAASAHHKGRLPGTVRGRVVGGANKRPRSTAGSDRMHGDTAAHGVPAARCRFIVNVSAGEGRFYSARCDPSHAHTNMAKAALNMLTRTSAFDLAEDYIYMNAVDASSNAGPPFDDVDVAARILDPVLAPLAEAQGRGRETTGAGVGGGGGGSGAAERLAPGLCRPAYGSFLRNMRPAEW